MKCKRTINLIVVHCSATRVNQNFSIEDLEACHKARGFAEIGYHYYITKDGTLYPGRHEDKVGAHARHYNQHSIGICYEVWTRMVILRIRAPRRRRLRWRSCCILWLRIIRMPPSWATAICLVSRRSVLALIPRHGSRKSTFICRR